MLLTHLASWLSQGRVLALVAFHGLSIILSLGVILQWKRRSPPFFIWLGFALPAVGFSLLNLADFVFTLLLMMPLAIATVSLVTLRRGTHAGLLVTFGLVVTASITDLLDEVVMPYKGILKIALYMVAVLVLTIHESTSSPHWQSGILLFGVTSIVGVSAWAEVRMSRFEMNLWWMIPLLVVGLVVFLYPVGLAWIVRRFQTLEDVLEKL